MKESFSMEERKVSWRVGDMHCVLRIHKENKKNSVA
jgi:hypothetical protein